MTGADGSGVALVVGAGDGIGAAVAGRFAAGGDTACLARRSAEKAAPHVERIVAEGGRARAFGTDTPDKTAVAALLDRVEDEVGPVEVCLFNARANTRMPALETTARPHEQVWRLACHAGFLTGREAMRRMLPRGCGTLLFTGATASIRGGAGFVTFAAAAPSTCRPGRNRNGCPTVLVARHSGHGGNPADVCPRLERTRPRGSVFAGGDVVAAEMEEVADLAVGGEGALRLPRRLEALHPPLPPSRRPVRVLRPVVEALVPAVFHPGQHLALRRAVAGQLVGGHDPRRPALPLQELAQQALGGPPVPPAPHQDVEHDAGPVHGAPQPVRHARDLHRGLVEVPFVADPWQTPPDPVGGVLAELGRPLPHGLVADDDAAGGQHPFHHAQAQREAEMEPHRLAADLGREAVPRTGRPGGRRAHAERLSGRGQAANPAPS
ncbi:MAG: hypothetical protein AVDCRST_MAG08-3128 [uncultured Acetobacteraceae bacterium]|uniref:Uncharacterized protein n=1 Tax=uncultured Acetobacteraceae bacterium TaxID=169975 RepID=A0A6J4J8H9_9PROT|nr:MAG: hypothetical protein AVDCRST_MAG08-3128 [uncultured Acetobacteraceae bacterium]